MRLGALLGPVLQPDNPNFIYDQASSLVDAGFNSLWSAQAIGRGFMMGDPLLTLQAAGAADSTVELGTAVMQLPLYHPMELAHRLFTLRQMVGARFSLGVGAGSTAADYAAYERDYEGRFKAFNETLARLRSILKTGGEGEANHAPWKNTLDSIPLLYGTWGKGVARASAEFDGWIASGMHRNVDEVCEAMVGYRAAGGGRALVSTLQVNGDTDLDEFQQRLQRFKAAGFDDAVLMILPGGPDPATVRGLV